MHHTVNHQPALFPSIVYKAIPTHIPFDALAQSHHAKHRGNGLSEVKLVFYPQRENDECQAVALRFGPTSSCFQRHEALYFYWDKGRYGLYDLASPQEKLGLWPALNTSLTTPLGIHLHEQLYESVRVSDISLEYMVKLLLLHLAELYAQCEVLETTRKEGLTPWQVEKVHRLITNQQDTFLPVKALSDHLGLSFYHFSRMFKKSTGFSPYQYMLKLKMQKALELILTSSESVIQVGLATGFENPGHFSRVFKKFHGATPRQIRKDQNSYLSTYGFNTR